ncbi:unnamed protein product, partial [marine sediment metagenome]
MIPNDMAERKETADKIIPETMSNSDIFLNNFMVTCINV